MPRLARTVFPGVPHHITQRGNRREDVFYADEDYQTYLQWLGDYSQQHRLDIIAYCLMTNHIHLVAVPATESSLEHVFRPLHMRYAQRMNRQKHWSGHLWQGRYFSSPMDERYTWAAIRYVEQNPVRAGMVRKAEEYLWSSANSHCLRSHGTILSNKSPWTRLTDRIEDWSTWLAEGDSPDDLGVLRRNTDKGLPCGSESFVRSLEKAVGRSLQFRPQGRPRRE
jgi:putative transposase